jgi:cob(I)alamin adenosyltransferase
MKGYLQIYTGCGKGKSTAAFGLAVRAAGAGLKVFIGQFIKGMKYSELNSFERFNDLITIKQYGQGCFIDKYPNEDDIIYAENGLTEVSKVLTEGDYNVVILDEINIAVYLGLIKLDDLVSLIKSRKEDIELVLTGRYAHPLIIEMANLVTEMKEIKHYYRQGIMARDGIEK